MKNRDGAEDSMIYANIVVESQDEKTKVFERMSEGNDINYTDKKSINDEIDIEDYFIPRDTANPNEDV